MTIASPHTLERPSAVLDLKVVEGTTPSSGKLEKVRKALLSQTSPHSAQTVAAAGQEWLKSALGPSEIEAIESFPTSRHEALLLRGFKFATTVPTPRKGFLPEAECVLDFDLLHFGMLKLMGINPYAVEFENEGKLVRNVVPVEGMSGTASSWGADIEFSWHTDNPNWPFGGGKADTKDCVPRYLAFTTVRNSEGVSTDVASIEQVLKSLPSDVVTELCRPAFSFSAPASNEGSDGERRIFPIVELSDSGPILRFDDNIVTATDKNSSIALSILRDCLKRTEGVNVILQPGDFFIFKNERVLHRRKAFTPLPDGQARWLRRVYGW